MGPSESQVEKVTMLGLKPGLLALSLFYPDEMVLPDFTALCLSFFPYDSGRRSVGKSPRASSSPPSSHLWRLLCFP